MTNDKLVKAARSLDWQIAPTFLQGEGAREILEAYREQAQGNEYLNKLTEDGRGVSTLMSARVSSMLAPAGIEVATTADFYTDPRIFAMIEGKHYSTDPGAVLRGHKNKSNPRNTPFIAQLVELVEDANGKAEFPLLIRGFDVLPDEEDKQGYGLKIVKRPNFIAIPSKEFRGESNGKRFNTTDEHGRPQFTKDGRFTFYANDNATLARLVVGGNGTLFSNCGDLGDPDDPGRVVLFPAEGVAQNFLNAKFSDLQGLRDTELRKVNQAYTDAETTFTKALQKK